jgi:hypothetical protein
LAHAAATAAGAVFLVVCYGAATPSHPSNLSLTVVCLSWIGCLVFFLLVLEREACTLTPDFFSANGVELSAASAAGGRGQGTDTSNGGAGEARVGSPTGGGNGPVSSYTFLTLVDTQVDDHGDFMKRPSIRVNYDKSTKSYVQEEVDEHAEWKKRTGRSLPGEDDDKEGGGGGSYNDNDDDGRHCCEDDGYSNEDGDYGVGGHRNGAAAVGRGRGGHGSGSSSLTSSLIVGGEDEEMDVPLSRSSKQHSDHAASAAGGGGGGDGDGDFSSSGEDMMAEYLMRQEGPSVKGCSLVLCVVCDFVLVCSHIHPSHACSASSSGRHWSLVSIFQWPL